MEQEQLVDWLNELKTKTPKFLEKLSGKKKGFFHYTLSGDLWPEKLHWGLGNSVFALKIYYSLSVIPSQFSDIVAFIKSFQKKDGNFYDPVVKNTSLPMRLQGAIKKKDMNRLKHGPIVRAESRQAISALKLFNEKPNYEYRSMPKTTKEIDAYLSSQNWELPWSANSHFSALMFLLSISSLENKLDLIDYSVNWVNALQKEDGSWYKGSPSLAQRVNGAMKYITGIKAATAIAGYNEGKVFFNQHESLIDTVLKATNDKHACENFNIIYVLRYANELSGKGYRFNEIIDFVKDRLDIYKQFYFPEYGGFSFHPNKSNTFYYGAPLARSKKEPDIHGTVMFVWGLSVIGNLLEINDEIEVREYIT